MSTLCLRVYELKIVAMLHTVPHTYVLKPAGRGGGGGGGYRYQFSVRD
jgi:hypothetical protein